jgi:hypothetical protein
VQSCSRLSPAADRGVLHIGYGYGRGPDIVELMLFNTKILNKTLCYSFRAYFGLECSLTAGLLDLNLENGAMTIPTEPIGNIPRPLKLLDAIR